jgi:hypothetical protein
MLGDTAQMLLDQYGGDLRKLREAAERDASHERKLLKQCKGLGDVGVSIFFREVQLAWDELYPFADDRALRTAERLGLEGDAKALAKRLPKQEFPRLVAALIRVGLAKDVDAVLQHAKGR